MCSLFFIICCNYYIEYNFIRQWSDCSKKNASLLMQVQYYLCEWNSLENKHLFFFIHMWMYELCIEFYNRSDNNSDHVAKSFNECRLSAQFHQSSLDAMHCICIQFIANPKCRIFMLSKNKIWHKWFSDNRIENNIRLGMQL